MKDFYISERPEFSGRFFLAVGYRLSAVSSQLSAVSDRLLIIYWNWCFTMQLSSIHEAQYNSATYGDILYRPVFTELQRYSTGIFQHCGSWRHEPRRQG